MTKTKRKTKPVPLNKMTRKQLLSRFRKLSRAATNAVIAVRAVGDAKVAILEKERDDFRQSLNGALEEIAALKGEVTALQKAALL